MNKNEKRIIWGTGILVVIIIALTIYFCISGDYNAGGRFIMGVLLSLFAAYIIGTARHYIVGLKKQYNKNKRIVQEKVKKQKALPIYHKKTIIACILYYVAIAVLFHYGLKIMYDKGIHYNLLYYNGVFFVFGIIGAIIFYLRLLKS